MANQQEGRHARFGSFDLDLETGSLTNHGRSTKLQPQPGKLLALLVQNAGDIVTREDIQQSLWPDGTFVDFDQSINFCIKRIREVLDDDASRPRYVETVPRRGYRFAARLELPDRQRAFPRRFLIVSATIAFLALAISFTRRHNPDPPPSATHLVKVTSDPGVEDFPSMSPDGQFVAYRKQGPEPGLYLARVGGERHIRLTEDRNGTATMMPAYSPDGQQIAYVSTDRATQNDGGIFVMGATGESPRRLTRTGFNPAWSPDGAAIVFATQGVVDTVRGTIESELWIVDVASAETKPFLTGRDAVHPSWSPDGRFVAYWDDEGANRDIWTLAVGDGEPVRVTTDAAVDWNPVWSADAAHLYFLSNRSGTMSIWRVSIVAASGGAGGEPELVIPALGDHFRHLSLSRDGSRAGYGVGRPDMNVYRLSFDPVRETAGNLEVITQGSRPFWNLAISPDDSRLATGTLGPDIALLQLDTLEFRKLTDDVHRDFYASFSPNGALIAFSSNRSGKYDIWTIRPDGGDLQQITHDPVLAPMHPIWSPDGDKLACWVQGSPAQIVDLGGLADEHTSKVIPNAPGEEGQFEPKSWSPDGRLIAGDVEDNPGVFLYDIAANETRRVTDAGGGPAWLSDSRRLVFISQSGRTLRLLDTVDGTQNRLWSASAPDAINGPLAISSDDTAIYFVLWRPRGDLWVAELR